MTEITIRVSLTIPNDSQKERAHRILEKAEQNCLIARSMSTRVLLEANITIG